MPHSVLCKIQMPRCRTAALPRTHCLFLILVDSIPDIIDSIPSFVSNGLFSRKYLVYSHKSRIFAPVIASRVAHMPTNRPT